MSCPRAHSGSDVATEMHRAAGFGVDDTSGSPCLHSTALPTLLHGPGHSQRLNFTFPSLPLELSLENLLLFSSAGLGCPTSWQKASSPGLSFSNFPCGGGMGQTPQYAVNLGEAGSYIPKFYITGKLNTRMFFWTVFSQLSR